MDCCCSTRTPDASVGTRNWRTAPSHRATTSRIPLSAPASTRSFTPSRRKPVAVGVAVTMAANGDHDLPGSYTAQDVTTSPDTKDSIVSSWFSGASTRPASTVLTGWSGPGATVLPASSATSARSWTPSPDTLPPPSSSGTSRLVQPSSAARRHQPASNEVPAACSSRSRLSGASFSRNDCVVEAKSRTSGFATSVTSGENKCGHVRLVDDLVLDLEQVDHVATHDLSLSLFVEAL